MSTDTTTAPDETPGAEIRELVREPNGRLGQVFRRSRAAELAVKHHREEGCDDAELIATAAAIAAFIEDGTVPEEPPAIVIVRNDEQIEVHIDGEVVASTTYDQAGHAGMDAVEAAALRVARALNYEPEETRP